MSDLTIAVDAALRMEAQWKGFFDVCAELKKLGSIEQATTERQAALNAVAAKYEKAKADLADLTAKIAADRMTWSAEQAALQSSLKEQAESARKDAEAIVERARREAAVHAESAKAQDAQEYAAHQKIIQGMKEQIDRARKDAAAARAERDDLLRESERIAEKIVELKQAAQKVLA